MHQISKQANLRVDQQAYLQSRDPRLVRICGNSNAGIFGGWGGISNLDLNRFKGIEASERNAKSLSS